MPRLNHSRRKQLVGFCASSLEYLRFRYTGRIVRLYDYLADLLRQESRLAWTVLAVTGLVVVATPLLAGLAPRLAVVTFGGAAGETESVPIAALMLTFLIFPLAWGYLLSGAALGLGFVWLFVSLLYVYLVIRTSLVLGRSYLDLVALLLPMEIAAITREGRAWGKMVLLVALASLCVRITPLPASFRRAPCSWGSSPLFGSVGNLQFIQKVVIVQQYKGAISLWIPLALLAAARTWPAFPLQARQRSSVAPALAMLAAVGFVQTRQRIPIPQRGSYEVSRLR